MKHKITISVFKILFGFFIFVLPVNDAFGQTIDVLNLNGATNICASQSSPHFVNFEIQNGSFPAPTTFVAELSDNNFTTIYTTTTISLEITTLVVRKLGFNVPNNLVGSDNYKIRIRTSTGYVSLEKGLPTSNIPTYFKSYTSNFTINGGNNANICIGGSITLAIDPGTPSTSPLSFTNLRYIWETSSAIAGPYTVVSGQTGPSLLVNTAGFYKTKIDYGVACTPGSINTISNVVEITQAGSGNGGTIASTLANPICSGSPTTLSVSPGFSYQWFKNTIAIAGAINSTYTTDQPGFYYVTINGGNCTNNSNIYEVKVAPISATIDALIAPQVNIVLSGESLVVTASSTATLPTYQWYFEGVAVAGQTNSTFTATAQGNYSVIVTENTTCLTSEEVKFILKNGIPAVNIPNAISPNNDGINDTWIIPQKYLSGSKTEIQILTAQGKLELSTTDYKNDWPSSSIDFKNTNPIYYYIITTSNQETKMGSITVIK